MLQLEVRRYALRNLEGEKRKYTKRKTDYWESEISESRKTNENEVRTAGGPSATLQLSKMTLKELRHEVSARGLKPKGLAKMSKKKLPSLLQ